MRSNMTAYAPHHLYKNFKFSELSEFSDVHNSPLPLHINYRVREPHVSHTGINVCAHCPLHLPKKVTEKPSVNHIGSSTSHQWTWNISWGIPVQQEERPQEQVWKVRLSFSIAGVGITILQLGGKTYQAEQSGWALEILCISSSIFTEKNSCELASFSWIIWCLFWIPSYWMPRSFFTHCFFFILVVILV